MKTKLLTSAVCIIATFSVNLAYGYHPVSPYAYALNNPVKYIDPDGQVVRIANNTAGALENLARIAATSYGSTVVSQLTGSRNVYTAQSVFLTGSSSYGGGNIKYAGNPWMPWLIPDGGSASSMVIMGHETYHGFQDDTHQIQYYNGQEKNRFGLERGAVGFENYLREVYNEGPMREHYWGLVGDDGSLFSPRRIPTNGENITNFTALGNNEGKTSFGFSYDKKTSKTNSQTYYIVVGVNGDKDFNFQIYSSKEEYKKATSNW